MFAINVGPHKKTFNAKPNTCPYCHSMIIPKEHHGEESKFHIEILFTCPNLLCMRSFIGYYTRNAKEVGRTPMHLYEYSSPGEPQEKVFADVIKNLSSQFTKIYNEAYFAEQHNLMEICGVGYRKALEFLIKDYAIYLHPDKAERIKKTALAQVISDFVTSANVKNVASRAAWLGNDETHYVRKWETLDVQHLKDLINLTVHWIESEELTKSIIDEMPETGPK